MTALTPSSRRGRPLWADVRFLLGVALILVSVSGVWLVVAAARQTMPILVASKTLVPGQEVSAADLRVVDVALGAAASSYLSAATSASGRIATRTVAAGELVPADALADKADEPVTRVVVRSAAAVPASVVSGTTVEVWAAPTSTTGTPAPPRILVADAVVAAVTEDAGVMSGGDTAIELVIPHESAAEVLEAAAAGSAMSVLPVSGGAGAGRTAPAGAGATR